jgi:uncharacterized protein (TIGR03084 family)
MVTLSQLLADLRDESEALDGLVAGLSDVDWSRPTPAPGWTIAHQISHLAWTDHASVVAATDTVGFMELLFSASEDPDGFVDRGAAEGLAPPAELLARWRAGRAALAEAVKQVPPGEKVPWFGTSMSPTSVLTGRLMETWAHGQDVADALIGDGGERAAAVREARRPTARLRHVAYLGYRTMAHGFAAHGRRLPVAPVRVELTGPDGALWTFGPDDAANRVVGPALDLCLLVAQRRHRADLALQATGPVADEWLDVAQAFAGPPGPGREPTGISQL